MGIQLLDNWQRSHHPVLFYNLLVVVCPVPFSSQIFIYIGWYLFISQFRFNFSETNHVIERCSHFLDANPDGSNSRSLSLLEKNLLCVLFSHETSRVVVMFERAGRVEHCNSCLKDRTCGLEFRFQ